MLEKPGPEDYFVEYTDEEMAYRRGYRQGFAAAIRNPEISIREICEWSHGNKDTAPPGSGLAGMKMQGVLKGDEHRHFTKAFNPVINKDDPIDYPLI